MTIATPVRREGWALPARALKSHYFVAGATFSLCGLWPHPGALLAEHAGGEGWRCRNCSRDLDRREQHPPVRKPRSKEAA
jgi:hypothetical protein